MMEREAVLGRIQPDCGECIKKLCTTFVTLQCQGIYQLFAVASKTHAVAQFLVKVGNQEVL